MKVKPLADRVLVKPAPVEEKQPGDHHSRYCKEKPLKRSCCRRSRY